MSQVAVVAPSLIINGEVVSIVPNSLSVKYGTGERKVKTQSQGGKQVETVIMQDVESAFGTIKFKIYNTEANVSQVRTIIDNLNNNLVQFVSSEGISGTMQRSIVTNDPEFGFGSDQETEIEMSGNQIAG
ncbi:hypothetical protein [Fangia hongkongensis]|uniref:hypothetical protein n=1 Tax=Fangia hongkongensis TaxID=270495 RepID=UPI00037C7D84|nr:hypothetical protein [Fangia hongkongensis]MBK2125551.1 hypothetical protein [Fangia hongkongensis]